MLHLWQLEEREPVGHRKTGAVARIETVWAGSEALNERPYWSQLRFQDPKAGDRVDLVPHDLGLGMNQQSGSRMKWGLFEYGFQAQSKRRRRSCGQWDDDMPADWFSCQRQPCGVQDAARAARKLEELLRVQLMHDETELDISETLHLRSKTDLLESGYKYTSMEHHRDERLQ